MEEDHEHTTVRRFARGRSHGPAGCFERRGRHLPATAGPLCGDHYVADGRDAAETAVVPGTAAGAEALGPDADGVCIRPGPESDLAVHAARHRHTRLQRVPGPSIFGMTALTMPRPRSNAGFAQARRAQ